MRIILLMMIGLSSLWSLEIFVDTKTGLVWQDDVDAKTVKKEWSGAKSYCKKLTLDAKSDWRVPNIKELQSIVDISRYKPAIKKGFQNIASSFYWSSSAIVSGSSSAWIVYFYSGHTNGYDKSDKYYVRCVRGSRQ
ncbi:MAG: DUF1566 domain-containing protein [Sulfurimonas sp.]|nr:DUF1566 domain-containing protein [Sulfurimonas sp.]